MKAVPFLNDVVAALELILRGSSELLTSCYELGMFSRPTLVCVLLVGLLASSSSPPSRSTV